MLALCGHLYAQTSPGLSYGYVPTAAEWNSYFAAKQDFLGSPPLLASGGTMNGLLTTAFPSANSAGFNLPPGIAPSSPNNGDLWTTSAGMFVQINGSTVGPLGSGGGGGGGAGGSNGQIQYNNTGSLAGFTMGGDCTFSQPNITCTKTNGTSFTSLATLTIGAGLSSSGGALTFTQGAANTWKGNVSNSSGNVIDNAWPNCSGANDGLIYTTGTGVGCNTSLASLTQAGQTVSGGAGVTSLLLSPGSQTIDCSQRPLQGMTATSTPYTITAPTTDGSCIVVIVNAASGAVIPTFSGFSVGSNTGDPWTTNNSVRFFVFIWRIFGASSYRIAAAQ